MEQGKLPELKRRGYAISRFWAQTALYIDDETLARYPNPERLIDAIIPLIPSKLMEEGIRQGDMLQVHICRTAKHHENLIFLPTSLNTNQYVENRPRHPTMEQTLSLHPHYNYAERIGKYLIAGVLDLDN